MSDFEYGGLKPSRDPLIGQIVDGRYRVDECIGRGGMGVVYRVTHTKIAKTAALKLLHNSLVGDQELIFRFHREAEAISRLNHPNIVQVFDFGGVGESFYIVMEYVGGEDLSAILSRDGPLDLRRGVHVLAQVCDALSEAHGQGIVHRDLKPENVRLSRTRDGQDFVKVMDFGLAKMLGTGSLEPGATARGSIVGTPYYMAPELIRSRPMDHRCDIYSLGAMAYRMFTGEHAFAASTPVGVLTRHITEEVVPPSSRASGLTLHPAIDPVILRAMSKDPHGRHADASELKAELITVLQQAIGADGTPVPAPLVLTATAPTPSPSRRASDDASRSGAARAACAKTPLPIGNGTPGLLDGDGGLARADAAFERSIRPARSLKLGALALVLGVACVLGYRFFSGNEQLVVTTQEIEPNNSPSSATPLAEGTALTGYVGRRVSQTESDRDWYRVTLRGAGVFTMHVAVSAIPNMDTTVELYDAALGRLTAADSAGQNGREQITNFAVGPGTYYLLVREVWNVGAPPTENVTDRYTVEYTLTQAAPTWEAEPNDRREQAAPLALGATANGLLGGREDQDWYRIAGTGHTLRAALAGVDGVDTVLSLHAADGSEIRRADDGGPGVGEQLANLRLPQGQFFFLRVARKDEKKQRESAPPSGIMLPYTLQLTQD